jgi:hypothetical protein
MIRDPFISSQWESAALAPRINSQPAFAPGDKQPLFSREFPSRQARLQLETTGHLTPAGDMPFSDGAKDLDTDPVLARRTRDGSLLSVRIPVTRANRSLLRDLRTAELEAWEAAC